MIVEVEEPHAARPSANAADAAVPANLTDILIVPPWALPLLAVVSRSLPT